MRQESIRLDDRQDVTGLSLTAMGHSPSRTRKNADLLEFLVSLPKPEKIWVLNKIAMNKLTYFGFIFLCFGCFPTDRCYDTKGNPISDSDKAFLPYLENDIYLYKDLNTNDTLAFRCDTAYDYSQTVYMDGDCDYYAQIFIHKVILGCVLNNGVDRINIISSIVSEKSNSSASYYTERNNCRELIINMHYANSIQTSSYHYSSYIVKSSPNLSLGNTGGALADSSQNFYETLEINDISFRNVNEIVGLNPTTVKWSDTLYINNQNGIIRFRIKELNYDLVYLP